MTVNPEANVLVWAGLSEEGGEFNLQPYDKFAWNLPREEAINFIKSIDLDQATYKIAVVGVHVEGPTRLDK